MSEARPKPTPKPQPDPKPDRSDRFRWNAGDVTVLPPEKPTPKK